MTAERRGPDWLDLQAEGDPHPRRFDAPDTLRGYLLKVERLSPEAAALLLERGEVGPPHARRGYRLERLRR
ncbi:MULTISPECIES: hypothetical protein [Deinococcus]|uniref:hypothetical protein n=1 Tax=Deinococcus TaxID=1298 RepID=UPI000486AC5A|nr:MULTISPECIES: hypothetical protein [Deinococcus]KEF35569.1 hypothetical protein RDMS_01450 [Deinococcus sp. RL]